MKKLLLMTSTVFALIACSATTSEQSVLVYINNGAIQCETDGQTEAETAQLLSNENIKVTKSECGHLANIAVIAMCGGPATSINVHTISNVDLEKAQALGFENVAALKQKDHIGYDLSVCK